METKILIHLPKHEDSWANRYDCCKSDIKIVGEVIGVVPYGMNGLRQF